MKLIFIPQVRFAAPDYALARDGDVLTINGEDFDFSPLGPGDSLPRNAIANDWFAGPVERDVDGTLSVPLILPIGSRASQAAREPEPITLTKNGPVALPE